MTLLEVIGTSLFGVTILFVSVVAGVSLYRQRATGKPRYRRTRVRGH